MAGKQKLELTWIGKDARPKLEPRILLEDQGKSYHAKHRVLDGDIFDNRLIFGDNLLALKALEQEFSGKVRCVFIDPPYNTGSAFTHYDDGLEHSIWLGRDQLEIIRRLMGEDGSLWITIDDNEAHYLKVLCDEVVEGRSLLVCCSAWRGDADRFCNLTLTVMVARPSPMMKLCQLALTLTLSPMEREQYPLKRLLPPLPLGEGWGEGYFTLKNIPKMPMFRCEWGHDDYSLNVQNLPMVQPSPPAPLPQGEGWKVRPVDPAQGGLFGGEDA